VRGGKLRAGTGCAHCEQREQVRTLSGITEGFLESS